MLRKTHLFVGTVGLIIFVLQGQYMDQVHDHLAGMEDAPRMLYRSSHIYFLLVSLINVLLGVYLTQPSRVSLLVQAAVSGVALLAPVAILAGFFLEPELYDLERPYTRPALYGLFVVGVVLSFIGLLKVRQR